MSGLQSRAAAAMAVAVSILCSLLPFALASPTPQQPNLLPWERAADDWTWDESNAQQLSNVGPALGPQLSSSSSIFGPSDPRWDEATERYDAHSAPHIRLVVQPGTEGDVPVIVRYANKHGIPFYAVNTGHGFTVSQTAFDGIQIDLGALAAVSLSPGGETAWIQGGAAAEEAVDELWELGYVTTTGSAGCPGILGVGLGGGHGRLQGFHGLVSDNFVTFHMVLANGRAITVSESSHPDLFWAMRGAGHNFGIVTSVEMRVYPRPERDWSFKVYAWTQDKIEPVFEELIRLHGEDEPRDLVVTQGIYVLDPRVSASEPIFLWNVLWAGPLSEAHSYLAPFDAIPALTTQNGSAPYNLISEATDTGADSQLCARGRTHMHYPSYLREWNVTAQRAIYDLFAENIATNPAAYGQATVVMEDYKYDAVARVDGASSAYPWRDRRLLNTVVISYDPDPSLDNFALTWARRTKELWNEGQPGVPEANYVNYAAGDEEIESVYGYEPWRLRRLRALKAKYDPLGRFNYYNPIPVGPV